MVCNRGDDAAGVGETVAGEVYAALVGWVVERIDVVPRCGVCERGDVPDLVGEQGGCGGILRMKETGEEEVGGMMLRDVKERQRDCCAVTEGAPTQDDSGLKVKQESDDDLVLGEMHFGGNGRQVVGKQTYRRSDHSYMSGCIVMAVYMLWP